MGNESKIRIIQGGAASRRHLGPNQPVSVPSSRCGFPTIRQMAVLTGISSRYILLLIFSCPKLFFHKVTGTTEPSLEDVQSSPVLTSTQAPAQHSCAHLHSSASPAQLHIAPLLALLTSYIFMGVATTFIKGKSAVHHCKSASRNPQ